MTQCTQGSASCNSWAVFKPSQSLAEMECLPHAISEKKLSLVVLQPDAGGFITKYTTQGSRLRIASNGLPGRRGGAMTVFCSHVYLDTALRCRRFRFVATPAAMLALGAKCCSGAAPNASDTSYIACPWNCDEHQSLHTACQSTHISAIRSWHHACIMSYHFQCVHKETVTTHLSSGHHAAFMSYH